MNSDDIFEKMEENPLINNHGLAKSTFKDILISPNNDDVIIPISATFDNAVLHIGIGMVHGISIEKFRVKDDKELKTSVKYATQRFRNDYYERNNNRQNITASLGEDYKKNVVVNGEQSMRDMSSIKEIDGQMSKLVDFLSCESKTERLVSLQLLPDASILKQNETGNITDDVKSFGDSTEERFLTTNIKSEAGQKPITSQCFDNKTPAEPDIKTDICMLSKFRLEAERSIPIEAIVKAYEDEMLENENDEEIGIYQTNEIGQITDPNLDFPLIYDIRSYLDEIYGVPKQSFQMFGGFNSDSQERKGKEREMQKVISDSAQLSVVVDIDNDYTISNSNVLVDDLDEKQVNLISDVCVDIKVVDKFSDSDELENDFEIESDNEIVNTEAMSLQDHADLTVERNETSINDIMSDINIFGILDIYINSDIHLDYSKIPVSKQCDQRTDYGYKFFSFSSFFK